MSYWIQLYILLATTLYQAIATYLDHWQQKPSGTRIDMGGYCLHSHCMGQGGPTVVIDHSLGGVEGYLLIDEIAKLTKVFIYDRAGYGWSDSSPKRRSSQFIVDELDRLLLQANVEPPYILVGDSFGSYNMRLYAYRFPEKVVGLVLTDGLHEVGMLKMPLSLQVLKVFFLSGFVMSTVGSLLGIVRLLGTIGVFEWLKPELRNCSGRSLQRVKRSFYQPQHWITMGRELWNLDRSGREVRQAQDLGDLPIVSIKAATFFKRSPWTFYMPIQAADKLREAMHEELLGLSTNCTQLIAKHSSHFVWVDEPEVILAAIRQLSQKWRSLV
jgi:pimeloyl-ACP methyl ester carboxylesterase